MTPSPSKLASAAAFLLAAGLAFPAWAVVCQHNIPAANPDSAYTDNGDGTVADNRTGLMWAKCAEGLSGGDCGTGSASIHTWAEALAQAKNSALAGHADWRLPNLKELRSLVEACRSDPAINDTIFPNMPYYPHFWSGSPYVGDPSYAGFVDFGNGDASVDVQSNTNYVRLVRGGQAFASFDRNLNYTPDAIGDYDGQTGAAVNSRAAAGGSKTLSGLATVTGIKIEGEGNPQYQVSTDNGSSWGDWTSAPGAVGNGDQIKVRLTTSPEANTARAAILTVGGVASHFRATTGVSDTTLGGLNDTGITYCGDAGSNSADCATVAVDGGTHPRQDARFGRSAKDAAGRLAKVGGSGTKGRDYTKVCNSGELAGAGACPADPALGNGANEWACTQDNVTGLIWEIKTADGGLRDKAWTYTWYSSNTTRNGGAVGASGSDTCGGTLASFGNQCNTEHFAAAVDAAGLCGHGDWRLPSRRELQGLLDLAAVDPGVNAAIDGTYFPNTVVAPFWSGSASAGDPGEAWFVDFVAGYTSGGGRSEEYGLRLVRGGQ